MEWRATKRIYSPTPHPLHWRISGARARPRRSSASTRPWYRTLPRERSAGLTSRCEEFTTTFEVARDQAPLDALDAINTFENVGMRLSVQLDRGTDLIDVQCLATGNHTVQPTVEPGHAWSTRRWYASSMSWMEAIRTATSRGSVHRCFVCGHGSFVALRMTAQCCETSRCICPMSENAASKFRPIPLRPRARWPRASAGQRCDIDDGPAALGVPRGSPCAQEWSFEVDRQDAVPLIFGQLL
jgi:hypothetical protein